jgi:hypothetical protein
MASNPENGKPGAYAALLEEYATALLNRVPPDHPDYRLLSRTVEDTTAYLADLNAEGQYPPFDPDREALPPDHPYRQALSHLLERASEIRSMQKRQFDPTVKTHVADVIILRSLPEEFPGVGHPLSVLIPDNPTLLKFKAILFKLRREDIFTVEELAQTSSSEIPYIKRVGSRFAPLVSALQILAFEYLKIRALRRLDQ